MVIKVDTLRVRNLAALMKAIRIAEDTEIFSGDLWKGSKSIREDTRVYYIEDVYPYLLIDTGRGVLLNPEGETVYRCSLRLLRHLIGRCRSRCPYN